MRPRWVALSFVALGIPRAQAAAGPDEAGDDAGEAPLEALTLIDTAFLQEELELQTTLAPLWLHEVETRTDTVGAALELEFGLTDRLQVGGELSFAQADTAGGSAIGLAGAELGLGWNVVSGPILVTSVGIGAEVAATPGLGSVAIGAGPFVLLDAALSLFHMSCAVALELDDEAAVEKSVGGAVYLDFRVVVPVLEALLVIEEDVEGLLAPGVFLHPASGWEIGVAALVGLTPSAPDHGARLQLTRELDLGGPERAAP